MNKVDGPISEAEFLERRVNNVKPHMDNLHSWLLEKKQKEMILDSSKTKEAVNYCLNRWENLENFIKYPEATFSTNAAERSVKNWVMEQEHHVLFCPLLKLPSRMVLLLKIISDVFLKKPLMLKLIMTGKNFSPGILKLLHIRFRGEWI